jgi:hypothetical protein
MACEIEPKQDQQAQQDVKVVLLVKHIQVPLYSTTEKAPTKRISLTLQGAFVSATGVSCSSFLSSYHISFNLKSLYIERPRIVKPGNSVGNGLKPFSALQAVSSWSAD